MVNDEVLIKLYGRGWAFPPTFSPEVGVVMAEGVEDIQQSLQILLSTQLFERIMRPNYGCDIKDYMFENIGEELISNLSTAIYDSILRYETRIEVDNINIGQYQNYFNQLLISIYYRLVGSKIEQQLKGLIDISDGRGVKFIP